MVTVPDIRMELEDLNHSELVALANWCGLNASRGIPRSVLYDHLRRFIPFREETPFDRMRVDVSSWIKGYNKPQAHEPRVLEPLGGRDSAEAGSSATGTGSVFK